MISLLPPFCGQEPLHRIGQDTRGGSFLFPSLFLAKLDYLSTFFFGRAHVRLANIDYQNSSLEIGGDIGETEYRGKGVGEIMYQKALGFVFDELNINRVYLHVLEDNEVAIKLYTKMGFQKEGLLRQHIFKNGKFRNIFVMSILREEFLRIKSESA